MNHIDNEYFPKLSNTLPIVFDTVILEHIKIK